LIIWRPDTCDCKLSFNESENWIATFKKCRLHAKLKGQNLLDTVLAQNRRFNLAFGNITYTEKQTEIVDSAKGQNILRIRNEDIDNFQEDLPHQNFIRRIFRI